MHCLRASKIWFRSKLGVIFDRRHTNISEWIRNALNTLEEEDLIYIAAILYAIWFARNQKVFDDKDTDDERVILSAEKSINDYQSATGSEELSTQSRSNPRSTNLRHQNHPMTNKHWNKPNEGMIKINCDANLSKEGRWGMGAIARDSGGNLLAAATWETPGADNPTLAEAAALYHSVRLASELGFNDVIFESDNATTIGLLRREDPIPRNYLGDFVKGIRYHKGLLSSCRFSHIGREANKVAHTLASLAHEEPNRVWINNTPPQIVTALLRDLIH
ncbi:hypothetical protein QL285_032158 [Trifolium repens]|nr:hypothetical protein QL285_032158 [Trifolium repens]